jgi:phytanoyl-CoA hydroxylase
VHSYEQDGYKLVRGAFPPEDLNPFRDWIKEAVGNHAVELQEEGKISELFEDKPFGHRLVAIHADKKLRSRSWNSPAFGPAIHALIKHPAIANALEPHLGPNISFNGDYHLRPKMPTPVDTVVPLHQDSQYYGKPTQHAKIITVWIPLVDVDENNGCLYVIPGSHRWKLFESERDENQGMRSFENPEDHVKAIPQPMKCGDILFFSNMTFHGSKVNNSDAVRWSVDIRYCRTRGTYSPSSPEERKGEDYLYEQLRKTKRTPSLVVRGKEQQWSFEKWRDEYALLKKE